MWIIDETNKQILNTKTGIVLIIKEKLSTLRIISGLTQIDLTIDEEILESVPKEQICKVFDSLETFNFIDLEQANQHINDQLLNYIERINDERI